MFRRSLQLVLAFLSISIAHPVFAGGPRWVAGSSYFNSTVKGQPIHWKNGQITYYADQGVLSTLAFHTLAVTQVETAAAVWGSVPTAGVTLTYGGGLQEDVNGTNVTAGPNGITLPADIQPTAVNRPLGVVFDADGSVINAMFGQGASDPSDCRDNGVITIVDNIATDGTILHALMILNGLCAANSGQFAVLEYQMVRGFGRILGLDWSQANESMFVGDQITTDGLTGWPLMHPVEYICSFTGIPCTTNGTFLRYDDLAAINRLYPVTSANSSSFPGKQITASATISVKGSIHFRSGQGMQGVNAVLRPLKPGTNVPDIRYTVTAVSGVSFQGAQTNPINGANDAQGNPFNKYGSDDPSLEGSFDLSGVPLPTGLRISDYQLSFEPLNPLYSSNYSVGPYKQGQVSPSGTLPAITLHGLTAGTAMVEDVVIQDSADESYAANDGTEAEPTRILPEGEWTGRVTGYGHTGWFFWPVRANRKLTIEATALDEEGAASESKARLVLGVWNSTDDPGTSPAAGTLEAFNGDQVGLTTLSFYTAANGSVRFGVTDNRGDGRPDYLYRARLLYADTVMPARISLNGGPIVIRGIGFHPNSVVTVNGKPAAVTSVTPTEITAVAPAANGITGTVPLVVSDPATLGTTTIQDGLSYDAAGGDALSILAAPPISVDVGVPTPFTVKAWAADAKTPASGAIVSFAVTQGTAGMDCGKPTCTVLTGTDGVASIDVTANSTTLAQLSASLSDGASVLTDFTGTSAPSIAAATPDFYVAIGSTVNWQPQAQLLNNGLPLAGQTAAWSAGNGAVSQIQTSTSNAAGIASGQISVGPLGPGADVPVQACLPTNTACARFDIYSVHIETAQLIAVSGAGQSLDVNSIPAPVTLRVTDAVGHPMAGAPVSFYETLKQWTSDCPPTGRCPSAPVLATQTVPTTSDPNGLVTLNPLTKKGIATQLFVTAATGPNASLSFEIDMHP